MKEKSISLINLIPLLHLFSMRSSQQAAFNTIKTSVTSKWSNIINENTKIPATEPQKVDTNVKTVFFFFLIIVPSAKPNGYPLLPPNSSLPDRYVGLVGWCKNLWKFSDLLSCLWTRLHFLLIWFSFQVSKSHPLTMSMGSSLDVQLP